MTAQLVLASSSPRRRELLLRIASSFTAFAPEIDETPRPGENPFRLSMRLAREKALAAAGRFPGAFVIGSDTSAALDGKTLGKPHGLEDFMDFFPKLSGRVHTVVTAVALVSPGGEITERICSVDVEMAAFTADDALRYWRTGEPADKAAGYAVQGIGARFIRKIDGSPTALVGLPLPETAELLAGTGFFDA